MVIGKLIRLVIGIVKTILKVTAVIILCLVILSYIPNLPPYIEFNAYNVTPPVPLKGALSINTLLNNADRLYEGALKGPEAFDVYNGVLYTGLHGGEIVKFVDGKIIPVAKFGQPCEGFWEEKTCGRPLGIKFAHDGILYVADAYYGLFKVNVNDGSKTQLISVNDFIGGKPIKLPNSVEIAKDGTIYWTISSSEFHLEDGIFDMLADGSGRLLRYDPKTKTNEILIDNLHFANGVVLSSNEEFVLVAETARSRIHRYYLKGPKKGNRDIFLDGLPGLPDNLKSDGSDGFFVPLVLGRDSSNPVLFQSFGPFPAIRRALSRFLALLELFFGQIDSVNPNYYTKRAIHYIGHFESLHGIGSKRITILHVDENGGIKNSYHCTDGRLAGISEVHWFNGAFYLGSPYNTYVGRVALEIPELHSNKKLSVEEAPVLKKQAHNQGQVKKQVEQERQKQPLKEQKQPIIQQKQPIKEEKVPVKQQKQEKKDQSKPVQQQKHSVDSGKQTVQQQKEPPKVSNQQAQQQKIQQEEKPAVQQQRKEVVKEEKQSAQQKKPQTAEAPKPVQQQKQQSEVPKPASQQKQQPTGVPKPAAQQQKQQSAEVPKPAAQPQKRQPSADVPKPPMQQQSAEVPKPPKQQKQQSAEVPKPPVQQQKQQSAEVPKPPVQQQKQQQQIKLTDKKPNAKEEKPPVNEQKKVPQHQKPQVKQLKPEVQQQTKPVKEQTIPAQQQKQPTKEQRPVIQQQKKPAEQHKDQKAANQQESLKVQKASAQQPVSQTQGKKTSKQQEQPSQTSHQRPAVQDKMSTKEQQPPK